jgi:hypothetical protein
LAQICRLDGPSSPSLRMICFTLWWMVYFDCNSLVFKYEFCKIVILQYKWN